MCIRQSSIRPGGGALSLANRPIYIIIGDVSPEVVRLCVLGQMLVRPPPRGKHFQKEKKLRMKYKNI